MTDRLRRPRKSILSRPELLDAVHLVLRDDGSFVDGLAALGLALDREVLGERILGDHHGGGVDPVLAPQSLETLGHVNHPASLGILGVHVAQLSMRRRSRRLVPRPGRDTPATGCRVP
jgi:hypothetical protein